MRHNGSPLGEVAAKKSNSIWLITKPFGHKTNIEFFLNPPFCQTAVGGCIFIIFIYFHDSFFFIWLSKNNNYFWKTNLFITFLKKFSRFKSQVWSLTFEVSRLKSHVSIFTLQVLRFKSHISSLTFQFSRFKSYVSSLTFQFSRFKSYVLSLTFQVSRIKSYVSSLTFQF